MASRKLHALHCIPRREVLRLKLEQRKSPVDILVVDATEKVPTANWSTQNFPNGMASKFVIAYNGCGCGRAANVVPRETSFYREPNGTESYSENALLRPPRLPGACPGAGVGASWHRPIRRSAGPRRDGDRHAGRQETGRRDRSAGHLCIRRPGGRGVEFTSGNALLHPLEDGGGRGAERARPGVGTEAPAVRRDQGIGAAARAARDSAAFRHAVVHTADGCRAGGQPDRKSTRLNSSHRCISY